MWLLSTDRTELHFFHSPEAVIGGYAILSHTWGDNEQTFQETQALRERCKETGTNPRDLATSKVRECCLLTERHGYRWVWNDTCCIDKTSSTELSEAINSMFHWYSLTEVCYAYLHDVDSSDDLRAPESMFRTARWHTRGWTLQELLAPFFVIFLSRDWETIGNKVELAPLLEQVTGVSSQVLTREEHYSAVCVAERMSWASKRNTTRVEDEAYCLMGLFNVNMPTIYGEGCQAFLRLQHKIVKQSFDTSLFAWGREIESSRANFPVPPEMYKALSFNRLISSLNDIYLLAPSPKSFIEPYSGPVRYTPSAKNPLQPYLDEQWTTGHSKTDPRGSFERQVGPFGQKDLPRFSSTNYGLECHFPIIESGGLTVVVLLCDTGRQHVGLLLHSSDHPVQDLSRKKYHTGCMFRISGFKRLIFLGNDFYNLRLNGTAVTAEWRDIFIADTSPPIKKDVAPSRCFALHSITPAPPFRLPHWLLSRLALIGMEMHPVSLHNRPVSNGIPLHITVAFEDIISTECVELLLGTCVRSPGRPAHWAKVFQRLAFESDVADILSHDCLEDHVKAWPRWMKDFGDSERTVRLSFSHCKLNPEHTLVIHIELEGRVYSDMKDRRNIAFPSREDVGLTPGKNTGRRGPRALPQTQAADFHWYV
ncbi:HET-domain-containing protein [Ganoderma leucocontextum]|nr:HET-domain-containing protein [Ganoderma leucocontextum]